MIIETLRNRFQRRPTPVARLYAAIVAAARHESFYTTCNVPDTVDGRFDMVSLHMFMILDRLKGPQHDALRQDLTDEFFKDMDRSLREMGTGDLAVAAKVRKMAEAFFGRVKAYRDAETEQALADVMARNIYVDIDQSGAPKLAAATNQFREKLAALTDDAVVAGEFSHS
jgi:cytochrome b pre-mRNA-processing protein 3